MFATQALGRWPGRGATQALVDILKTGDRSRLYYDEAVQGLVARKDVDAKDLYLPLCEETPDYIAGRRPVPLPALASLVSSIKDAESARALAGHLRFEQTSPGDVRAIADAVLASESKSAVGPFQLYLVQHRATDAFALDIQGLFAAVDVLLFLGGPDAQEVLADIEYSAQTLPALRRYIHDSLLGQTDAAAGTEK